MPPQMAKKEIIKKALYKLFQKVLDEGRGRDIIILMGDFSTKIGGDNKGMKKQWAKMGSER